MTDTVSKLLIVNRGEIALRVVRTAREMGIPTVVVYAEQDRHSQYVKMADEAFLLSGDTYADTYLNEDLLIDILRRSGADAVHPGYGFLSEVPSFADKVIEAGATWVGPSSRALTDLGDKISARRVAVYAKVPPVPGISHSLGDMRVLLDFAHTHGYPLMLKRADGGGGRGITPVRDDDELRGFRIHAGDLLLTVPTATPVDDAIMLIELNGKRAVHKIKKLDGGKLLLQTYDHALRLDTVELKNVLILGRCVRLETQL